MKIKTFYDLDNKKLDEKVNAFLDNSNIEMVDIKFRTGIFFFAVMVLFKEN